MPQKKRRNNKKKKSKKSWKASMRSQREKQIVNIEEILNIEIAKAIVHNLPEAAAEESAEALEINGEFEASPDAEQVPGDDHLPDNVSSEIDSTNDDYDYEELADNSEYEDPIEGSSDDYDSYESDSDYSDPNWRPTNVVIRGIPIHFSEEEVMAELKSYCPIALHRMISRETWQPMPLVLVQVHGYQEDFLFNMEKFRGLPVKVEPFHFGYNISQCKKCKQFGHVKNDCELLNSWKQEASTGNESSTGDLGIGTTPSDNSLSSTLGSSHSSSNSNTSKSIYEEDDDLDESSPCNETLDKTINKIDAVLDDSLHHEENVDLGDESSACNETLDKTINQIDVVLEDSLHHEENDDLGDESSACNETLDKTINQIDVLEDSLHHEENDDLGDESSACNETLDKTINQIDVVLEDSLHHEENHDLGDESSACNKTLDKTINKIDAALGDSLQLVWNGIPTEIKTLHILNDLKSKGFSVTKVYRLKGEDDRATESVVFQVPKEQDHIFYMSCCLGFHVLTEKYDGDFSRLAERSVVDDDRKEFSTKKPIHVVIRGIHKDVPENDVLEDLKRKHFTPLSVTRLVNPNPVRKKTNTPLFIVLVQMHREESHIHKLKCILGFSVEVEPFVKHMYPVPQCKQCKKFGHTKDCPVETEKSEGKIDLKQTIATINVVLKGIPLEYEDDNVVFDELKRCSLNPIAIHRMALGSEILPMYLVQVPKTERRILFLTCFLGFDIAVEKYNPDLYPINQCDHCKNFGHHKGKCSDHLQEADESYVVNKDIPLEIDEETPKTQDIESRKQSSTKRKRQNSEVGEDKKESEDDHFAKHRLQDYSTENASRHSSQSSLHTTDASTNTDNIGHMYELERNIETYQSIIQSFLKNMGLFVTSYEQYDIGSNSLAKTLQCVLTLQSLCTLTTPFLDGVTTVLKSMTSLMMDMPNMPGVKANTLNEQLHLLEKLEEIKRNLEACPGKFTKDYDTHFPELQ